MADNNRKCFSQVEDCVEDALSAIGGEVILGLPIGVGKPTHIANEFYRRAKNDPSIRLSIFTGLTLCTPQGKNPLEKRFLQPLVERLFPDYPDPAYINDVKNGTLPSNVKLREIYLPAGEFVKNRHMQQNYVSSNFTHVARDVADAGCNVTAAILARHPSRDTLSMGSNADAAISMFRNLDRDRKNGRPVAILGQINANMPYMFGDGEIDPGMLTGCVDNPSLYHKLFITPKEAVSSIDYFVGLHVSALLRDGGTFQVGLGSLGDAVTYAMQMRHERNDVYLDVLSGTGVLEKYGHVIQRIGGTDRFNEGLYGCTEFLSDGFLHLLHSGVIRRTVYDHVAMQRLENEGKLRDGVSGGVIDALLDQNAIARQLTDNDFEFLSEYGIFRDGLELIEGHIHVPGASPIRADLADPAAKARIETECLGAQVRNGCLIHAGFFLGPESFYQELMEMDESARSRIRMKEIGFVNELYSQQELKELQRRDARFVNTTMMVTATGGAISDTLDNNLVVSGVGGQYNFVSMAHALGDGRSILILRSTRMKDGEPASNIVWSYGNVTIPRHLRDIFVTEYGIADLRGKSDADVIKELLNVTDSRFQKELLRKAKSLGKLPDYYCVPDRFKNNYPERLTEALSTYQKERMFPAFPFGTELTREELVLAKSLRALKNKFSLKQFKVRSPEDILKVFNPPKEARPYLERMRLEKPSSVNEIALQKMVLYALASEGII